MPTPDLEAKIKELKSNPTANPLLKMFQDYLGILSDYQKELGSNLYEEGNSADEDKLSQMLRHAMKTAELISNLVSFYISACKKNDDEDSEHIVENLKELKTSYAELSDEYKAEKLRSHVELLEEKKDIVAGAICIIQDMDKKYEKEEEEELKKLRNDSAIKIQSAFRGHLVRRNKINTEGMTPPADKTSTADETSTTTSKTSTAIPTPTPTPKTIDQCLEISIKALELEGPGARLNLSKYDFKSSDQPSTPTLGASQIARIAKLDPIKLNNSVFGGLTFDFAGADKDSVQNFLKNTYCANFRGCTIKNLNLEDALNGVDPKEKDLILKNFKSVKFENCDFDKYKSTGGFRFRSENLEGVKGLDEKKDIAPRTSIQSPKFEKLSGQSLMNRGGYTPAMGA